MRRLLQRLHRRFINVLHKNTPPAAEKSAAAVDLRPEPPISDAQAPISDAQAPISDAHAPVAEPAPPAGAAAVCAALRRAVRALCPPVERLEEAERQRLGGLIFFGAVHFVTQVSAILRERPDLSPEPAHIHAAGLAGRQQRATRWVMVHGALVALAELVNDCYLYEQGTAVEEAQRVIDAYDLALAQALMQGEPTPQLIEDGLPISRARVVLQRCQRRQKQARQREARRHKEVRAAAGKPAAGKPAAGAKKARRRSPGQTAAEPLLDIREWGRRAQERG